MNRSYRERLSNTHPSIENSSKFEVIAPSKTEGVCVNKTPSKINENIQEPQIEEIKELQEEIKKTTGHKIQVKKIRELLENSSIERIRYHLENWHIHKEHQKFEGAGWFFTVIEHDIAPEKKITGGTGEKNGNIPLKDNFKQREYTQEEWKSFENRLYTDLEEEEKKPVIPYIERKGCI